MSDSSPLRTLFEALVLTALVAAALGGAAYFIFTHYIAPTPQNIGIACVIVAGYLLIAYVFTPLDVDENELTAWNNPFTFKDDAARFSLVINIVMIPGIIIIHSAASIIEMLRGK